MKKSMLRVTATLMALAMVVGMLVVVPMTSNATTAPSNTDVPFTMGKGYPLPEGATTWDGTMSEGLTVADPEQPAGTKTNPYLIYNVQDFEYFRTTASTEEAPVLDSAAGSTADTYFKLMGNVYYCDENYKGSSPGGTNGSYTFTGNLDGNGYGIYNAYLTPQSWKGGALFNTVKGTIENLSFYGFYASTYNSGSIKSACLSWSFTGTMQNCHVINSTLRGQYIGGFSNSIGEGTVISDCTVSGVVGSYSDGSKGDVGAFAGSVSANSTVTEKTIFKNCTNYATLSILTNDTLAGGIVGTIGNSAEPIIEIELDNCVNYGSVETETFKPVVGGLVGKIYMFVKSVIKNSVNYGNMTAGGNVGGLVALLDANWKSTPLTLDHCANYGDITSTGNAAGGLVSNLNQARATFNWTNCVNYGNITAAQYAGGILGISSSNQYSSNIVNLTNCATYGNITATTSDAGFVFGYISQRSNGTDFTITNFVADGTVTAPTHATAITGQLNVNSGNTPSGVSNINLTNVFVRGTVSATAEDGVAAVFSTGTNNAKGNTFTMNNCGFNLDITANGVAVTTGWVDSTGVANNVEYNAISADVFAGTAEGTTVGTMLNTYAYTNSCTPWAQTETSPVLVTALGISGATMSLSSNMALNMKLAASTLAGLTVTNVAFVDADGNGINAVKDDLGRYSASYVKRAADMAKEMKLHLVITIAGNEYVSTNILTYSPLTYLTNLYADYTGEKQSEANATKVLNVVTAMLGYGAAAETKDSGATTIAAKMTALGITAPTFTEDYTDHISGVVTEDDKTAINNIAQVGATLTGGMELTFAMKNTAYTALSIADFGTFTADENGKITVTGINAAMIKDTLRLTFTGDGVDGISANFTVGDFLESRRDNADETALAEATILYMMAARAYVLN